MKKKSAKKKGVKESTRKRHYVVIDFPEDDAIISHCDYTVKIGASKGDYVEVSVDGGNWFPCRMAEGYWWFDWVNYREGLHKIEARLRVNDRTLKNSTVRKCRYQLM